MSRSPLRLISLAGLLVAGLTWSEVSHGQEVERAPELVRHRFTTMFHDRPVDLRLETTRVAVQLEARSIEGDRLPPQLLARFESDPLVAIDSVTSTARSGFWFFELRGTSSEVEIVRALERLTLAPEVASAAPVLRHGSTTLVPTDHLILTLERGDALGTLRELLAAPELEWVREFPSVAPTHVVRFRGSVTDAFERAKKLSTETGVIAAEIDFIRIGSLNAIPNDTFFSSQWFHRNVGQQGTYGVDARSTEAWDLETGNSAITVAVLDSGIDLDHPDLIAQIVAGHDATNAPAAGGAGNHGTGAADGHGTSCAGLIGASGNNGLGVAGVAWNVSLQPIRIFDNDFTQDTWIIDGITWAVDNGADLLSNSWGGGAPSIAVQNAFQYGLDTGRGGLGSASFCASGNGNVGVEFPAAYPETIAVGASSPCDERKTPTSCDGETNWGSNFGAELDLVAPGVLMATTDIAGAGGYVPGDYIGTFNGTSSATPLVAGAAALLLSVDPSLTAAQVRSFLRTAADDQVGPPTQDLPGFDTQMGFGRLNVASTLALLSGPAGPSGATCVETATGEVTLAWVNGATYDAIEVFLGSTTVATLAGSATSVVVTGITDVVAQFGIRGVVGGVPTISARCDLLLLGGATDLVFSPAQGTVDGGVELANALIANARSSLITASLGIVPDLDAFERIWVNLGVFPAGSRLSAGDAERLEAFLTNGVGGSFLYLEGADTWFFDPPTVLHPHFGITGLADGGNDLGAVVGTGAGGCDLTGLDLVYTGENSLVDRIAPNGNAIAIQTNNNPLYDVAVFRDGGAFRTIGASFELGGFFDGASTRADLIAAYLACFGGGFIAPVDFLACASGPGGVSLGWANPGGYDTIEIDRNGVLLASIPGTTTTFLDSTIGFGSFVYAVRGVSGGVASLDELCTVDVTPPAPTFLTCDLIGEDVALAFTVPTPGDSITVRRDGVAIATLGGADTTFTDLAPAGGMRTYSVVVTAGGLDSPATECTLDVTPAPLSGFACSVIAGVVQLSWSNGEAYDEIEITKNGTLFQTIGGGITSVIDNPPGTGVHTYLATPRIDGVAAAESTCSVSVAPSAVSSLACSGGALTASLSWSLGEVYDEIEIRRDGVFHSLLAGTATSTIDASAPAGSHAYAVIGRRAGLDASPANCSVTVTLPAVTGLACTGGVGTASLSWANGATYSSIEVRREGALIATLGGTETAFVDLAAPLGVVSYSVLGRVGGSSSAEAGCSATVLLAPITGLSCGEAAGDVTLTFTLGATYDAIAVLRDGATLATLSGTDTSYVDLAPPGGMRIYSLVPTAGATSAVETTCAVAVTPAPVANLSVQQTDPCSCAATLTWTLGEAADALEVRVDGVLSETLAGTATATTVTLPPAGLTDFCVRPVIDGISGSDACATAECTTVTADPIGALACSVDDPTCLATVDWPAHPTAASLEVRLDGTLVATLAGSATQVSVSLVGTAAQTISVSGVNDCGAPLAAASCTVSCAPPSTFVRSDANGDGLHDISDPIVTLTHLFDNAPVACLAALDANDDEQVDLADVIRSLDAIFGLGAPPAAPFPACGPDPTLGSLGCVAVPLCP